MKSRLKTLPGLLLAILSHAVPAEPLEEIAQTLRAGDHPGALRALRGLPASDAPQYRFLLGTVLASNGQVDEAIEVFRRLVEDFPGLPEPYNNLAALYVRQGRLDEAKEVLEKAIRTDESYATVYDNLSTVYVEMARNSYVKALQLEENRALPPLRLLFALEGQTGGPSPPLTIAEAETTLEDLSSPAAAAAPVPPPAEAALEVQNPELPEPPAESTETSSSEEVVGDVVTPVAAVRESAEAALSTEEEPPAAVSEEAAVAGVLRDWAAAWASQDVEAYLAYYAADFRPVGQSRTAWEVERRARLAKPGRIEVELESIEVTLRGPQRAVVRLWQHYASDRYRDKTRKRFELIKVDGSWRIRLEKNLEVVR